MHWQERPNTDEDSAAQPFWEAKVQKFSILLLATNQAQYKLNFN